MRTSNKNNGKGTSIAYASYEKTESNNSKESNNKESDNKDKHNEIKLDEAKDSEDSITNKAVSDSDKNNNTITLAETDTTNLKKSSNYKEFFKKDVFMGDSVTEALPYYDFLQEENVYAKKGIHINDIKKEINKIEVKDPINIYLLYGLNDMAAISTKWFIDEYRELIHSLEAKFPNSNIYVQSILPVLSKAEGKESGISNEKINEYNSKLIDMAKEENVNFLNIASIPNDKNKNLYEPDGIHFKANFYTLLLNYLVDNVE